MHRNINIEIPNPKNFIDAMNNNELFAIDSEYIWDLGFDTKPFADYEVTDNYPECCEYHSAIKKHSNEWFSKFPNCCDDHKTLMHKRWFKKEAYNHIPNKIIQQTSFSENFISKNINEENWYQEITDYLTYNFESFGTPNVGSHLYFSNIQHWIKDNKPTEYDFPKWKRNQLIEFLEKTSAPFTGKQTDLNILKTTFDKWLKTIPSLNYFIEMKRRLNKDIPFGIILHEPSFNRFTGLTKFKIKTEFELIEILIQSTKKMLSTFNSPELLKNGAISDSNKYHLDLINENHSVKQNKLLIDYNKSEIKYVKIIKRWLKNEKEYFASVTPIIKELKSMPKKFEIEKRNTFEKDYLKVFLHDKSNVEQIATLLTSLESVRKANVTKNTQLDITVYPSKMYDINEVQEEISAYLNSYFESGELEQMAEEQILNKSDKSTTKLSDINFKVAVSFPGEKRGYVSSVVDYLKLKLGKDQIFYDFDYQAQIARPNADILLQDIYHKQSDLIVIFLCEEYNKKEWCGLEWRAIRDLIKSKEDERIMFVKFDNAEIDGTFSIDGYIDASFFKEDKVAQFVLDRINVL
jgi:hypothetical protein